MQRAKHKHAGEVVAAGDRAGTGNVFATDAIDEQGIGDAVGRGQCPVGIHVQAAAGNGLIGGNRDVDHVQNRGIGKGRKTGKKLIAAKQAATLLRAVAGERAVDDV